MQRNHLLTLWVLAGAGLLALTSCRKNLYDEEKYNYIIHYLSPVDSVDQSHDWQLSTACNFRITPNAGENIQQVQLLTANPLQSRSAAVVAQTFANGSQTVSVAGSVPKSLSIIYAALIDADGLYYVKPINPKTDYLVNFSSGYTTGTPSYTPQPQAYTYLFEENFPAPGDYDYNDLVLRIGMLRTAEKQVTVTVTVVAVGSTTQLACFLRLLNTNYADVDSVRTTTGLSFNDNLPKGSAYLVDNMDLLRAGRNQEAVINLFADAHWAMSSATTEVSDYGVLARKRINVGSGSYMEYENKVYKTISYVIYFNNANKAEEMTMEMLDPFLVTMYNGGIWETHLDHLKAAQVLYKYSVSTTLKDLPWALKIPMSEFRYPIEGSEIGFRKRTSTGSAAMFGAYTTQGHSFGEWAEDRSASLDWYHYPNEEYVW